MQGVIWFPGSTDPVFARITDRTAMTDWVPLLETVQVSHPKLLPPVQSMAERPACWRSAAAWRHSQLGNVR